MIFINLTKSQVLQFIFWLSLFLLKAGPKPRDRCQQNLWHQLACCRTDCGAHVRQSKSSWLVDVDYTSNQITVKHEYHTAEHA